jgi:hypothetical protein
VKDQLVDDDDDVDNDVWPSLCQDPHFEQFMPFSRWKDLWRFFPEIFADEAKKETDPWYQFSSVIDEFNTICQSEVVSSQWISIDETMSAWKPLKTALGGLPNISFIVRKPEPLGKNLNYYVGTEFKTTGCPITGIIRSMEIQRGKEGMKSQKFNKEIRATSGCTLRLLPNTIPQEKEGVRHGIRGDAWFGSVRTASEVALRGHNGIFQIKQYHASFLKDYIEEALKEAPGGVHIFPEGMTQDEVKLIALGYRYS